MARLQFGHHGLDLVHFLLGQFFEVLLQILGAFDSASFERRQQGIALLGPQCLKAGFDGGWRRRIGSSGERRLDLTDIEAAEAAFDQRTSSGDDFFMQSMVVATQHDDAAVGDNDRMSERGIVNYAGRDAGQVFGLRAKGPNFCPQQP